MKRYLRYTICSGVILACFAFQLQLSHAVFKRMPYLQAVTANSIVVLQETDSMSPVTVEYGVTNQYGSGAATVQAEPTTAVPATYVHRIRLTGLQPDTMYHYRVVQGDEKSADFTFWSAANPGTPFRFAWMADCRSGTGIHDRIARRIKEANPRFLIYGGDLCSNSSYQAYQEEFFRPAETALIATAPFFNTTGNHEGWSQNTRAYTAAPLSASDNQGYYSFDYGDLHILVLNYMDAKHQKEQADFAKRDLAATRKAWQIVVSHSPAYCAGGHGEDRAMQALTREIFEPARVAMVLSGHSHFYQHNLVNGIHHLVIGSAGAPLYEPRTASYTLKSVKDYNYAVVDVTPESFRMTVYNQLGKVLDTIELK